MAKLLATPFPFPQIGKDFDKGYKEQCEALDKIPAGRCIKFPVADGYANYYIYSFSPPVLQFIDFLDGYEIPDAHIRGLREADLREMVRRDESFRKLFSKQLKNK
jgi:hypothetical protein